MMMCSRCKKRVAVVFITRLEGDKTYEEGLCLTCAKELGIKPVNDLVEKMGLSDDQVENMSNQLMEMMENEGEDGESGFDLGGAATFPFLQNLFSKREGPNNALPAEHRPAGGETGSQKKASRPKEERRPKLKYLEGYCENLTRKAREGVLDRIVGRDKEIYRVEQILNRRTKNNPCLIGEPGVGKTAIAEGIALKIAKGDAPPKLLEKEIYRLDLTALVAGTQFRGQFESRVKGLIDEVRQCGNVILFIDEVHNLVGTGDAEGSMNAANILKPALSRGEIQVIGATTFNEYRKYIEKDSALERRFQPVTVEEPSIAETVEVLSGIKEYYENYHRVKVPARILENAVTLSERYITDRYLPDKAIDLLDEACSCAALRSPVLQQEAALTAKLAALDEETEQLEADTETTNYERLAEIRAESMRLRDQLDAIKPELDALTVTDEDVATVLELWTGIPATKIREGELQKVAHLKERMLEKIIGQDEAVELVANAIKRTRVQITARRRPASFIFVGPTGVGKTELVKVLAHELFDSADPLIRLDMSEYMDKYSVSRIVGAPPGYIGYDEAGQLTEKVRRKPYSVVLFDEIEKAHPDVMNILLQILDEGKITDAHGRTVNFENTVIVMTSNAGSNRREGAMGFGESRGQLNRDRMKEALGQFLRPEFIARVDEVVVFNDLDRDAFRRIAALMLDELKAPMKQKEILFGYDDAALEALSAEAFGGKHAARDLRRVIRREVEDRVAALLVDEADHWPAMIKVTAEDGKVRLVTG